MSVTPLSVDLLGTQGREAERGIAAPASALIHQNRNNGIEYLLHFPRDGFQAEQEQVAVNRLVNQLPTRLKKKMFALRLRIEWMVHTYGVNHVGMQTLTIRENVSDGKEFERRFKSIATNAFPKIYVEWLRVFERQQRGAWHAHVVVVTKEDIRTDTDVAALNQLFKDKRDRKISKAVYYVGIKRLASPNLKAIWKEFRRLCSLGEFKAKRQKKGARYYKFDACHLLPIISTAQALAVYVSKYISKGFEYRRPDDKGMRLVGATRNVSRVCNERFSWAGGGGKLHRLKLGILAGLLKINSLDEFTERFGSKWAYQLRDIIQPIVLPRYDDMKLAAIDGWDLKNEQGESWPFPFLELPADIVNKSHMAAYVRAKELLLRRSGRKRDFYWKRRCHAPTISTPLLRSRPTCKSWLEYTCNEN